jgi:hypothetical protein
VGLGLDGIGNFVDVCHLLGNSPFLKGKNMEKCECYRENIDGVVEQCCASTCSCGCHYPSEEEVEEAKKRIDDDLEIL